MLIPSGGNHFTTAAVVISITIPVSAMPAIISTVITVVRIVSTVIRVVSVVIPAIERIVIPGIVIA